MSATRPSFEDPTATFAPTVSARSGRTFCICTTRDGAEFGRSSISAPTTRPETTWSRIATTVPSTGEYTSVPATAPTSSVLSSPPSSWYQVRPGREDPVLRRQSLARRPSFACGPAGWSTSAPSAEPWKPTAVTPPSATGDSTRRFPTVARICGSGGAEVTGSGAGTGESADRPLVRDVTRLKVPRPLAVTFVYAVFAATMTALLIAIGLVAFDQARNAGERIDDYVTDEDADGQTAAERDIDGFQLWLDDHGLERIQVREQIGDAIDSLSAGDVSGYVEEGLAFAQGAALSFVLFLFSLILIVVISIYMLLDMPRLERAIDTRFPPHGGPPLTHQIESALWGYVRGQLILSTVIGGSAGVGMWH